MFASKKQTPPGKSASPLRAVRGDDIQALYEATRGAPEANRLLSIIDILSDQQKDYAKADAIIRDVMARYERRHLRTLRSKQSRDDKRKQKIETTLALFADILARLEPMVRAQAARSKAASPL